MNNNGQYTIPAKQGFNWDLYDVLPSAIKRIIQNAHYNSVPGQEVLDSIENFGAYQTARWLKNGFADVLKNDVRLTYGPDHPQAQ